MWTTRCCATRSLTVDNASTFPLTTYYPISYEVSEKRAPLLSQPERGTQPAPGPLRFPALQQNSFAAYAALPSCPFKAFVFCGGVDSVIDGVLPADAVTSIVPVVGNPAHDAIDTAADAVDTLPF